MIDPFIVYELISGDVAFPQEMHSDIARFNFFANKNNVSIDDLKQELERLYFKLKKTEDKSLMDLWITIANKSIEARKSLVKNSVGVLDTKLRSSGSYEYGAKMILKTNDLYKKDRWIVQFIEKFTDDAVGSMTGIPHAKYWSGTPGQYYASTILGLGKDDYGSQSDTICIDGGTNWNISGISALRDEIEKKYGDEIRKELINENYKTKKDRDNLRDILKPKSQEKIISLFPKSWEIKKATDFLKEIGLSFEIIKNETYKGDPMINIYIKEFENEILLDYIPKYGWTVIEQFDNDDFWEDLSWYQAKKRLLVLIEKWHKELKKEGIYRPLSSPSTSA